MHVRASIFLPTLLGASPHTGYQPYMMMRGHEGFHTELHTHQDITYYLLLCTMNGQLILYVSCCFIVVRLVHVCSHVHNYFITS